MLCLIFQDSSWACAHFFPTSLSGPLFDPVAATDSISKYLHNLKFFLVTCSRHFSIYFCSSRTEISKACFAFALLEGETAATQMLRLVWEDADYTGRTFQLNCWNIQVQQLWKKFSSMLWVSCLFFHHRFNLQDDLLLSIKQLN